MNPQELQFRTTSGHQLHYRRCGPPGEPRGVVAIVHGICEHGGRYLQLAGELCAAGYASYVLDLRGHGRSQGERVLIRKFDHFLDDLREFLAVVRQHDPQGPLFLLGHSMGGAIVLRFALTQPVPLAGIILSAPAVRVAGHLFPLLRHLAGLASRLFPRLRVVRMGSRFLSRDAAVVADFRNDPWVYHDKFPVRTGAEILGAARRIQRELRQLKVPLLILHGTGDYVTDPAGSRLLHAEASSRDKTLQLYPGLYHDLFHEPERAAIVQQVLRWLAERCPATCPPDSDATSAPRQG